MRERGAKALQRAYRDHTILGAASCNKRSNVQGHSLRPHHASRYYGYHCRNHNRGVTRRRMTLHPHGARLRSHGRNVDHYRSSYGRCRLFARTGPHALADIASATISTAPAVDSMFAGVAPLQSTGQDDVSFLDNRGYAAALETGIHPSALSFATTETDFLTIPQLGQVIVEDRLEVGANSTIDRGPTRDTIIGTRTRIEDLLQIGHNVRLGRYRVIVAQVGIAGSTSGFCPGRRSGPMAGRQSIGQGGRIGAQAGVITDIPAGSVLLRVLRNRARSSSGRLPR